MITGTLFSEIDYTKSVEVYRNLSREAKKYFLGKKVYSIKQRGKVVAWATAVMLNKVTFHVRASGRKRVLLEKRKNVHATAKGFIVDSSHGADRNDCFRTFVSYNPYESEYFLTKCFTPPMKLSGAGAVILNQKGVTAINLVGEKL